MGTSGRSRRPFYSGWPNDSALRAVSCAASSPAPTGNGSPAPCTAVPRGRSVLCSLAPQSRVEILCCFIYQRASTTARRHRAAHACLGSLTADSEQDGLACPQSEALFHCFVLFSQIRPLEKKKFASSSPLYTNAHVNLSPVFPSRPPSPCRQ